MKLKAKTAILFDAKKIEAGSVFEADADHGLVLVQLGWAEAVKAEKAEAKSKAKKK